jgi:hypothetical protein
VRLFHTVENHVILNVQHGEADVDDLADYVKVWSREPYNAIRALFDNENLILRLLSDHYRTKPRVKNEKPAGG